MKTRSVTDRQTDQQTNGPTNRVTYKKKIDKSIDFLRGGEKKNVSIFRLRSCGKVAVSWGLNGAGPEIDT